MTTHDGPFNWESEHFHYRQVNIWPRPWQRRIRRCGARPQQRNAAFSASALRDGHSSAPATHAHAFDAYREVLHSKGRPPPAPTVRLTSDCSRVRANERDARARGEQVAGSAHQPHCVCPVPQPAGYFLGGDNNASPARGNAAAQLHQDRRVSCAPPACRELTMGGSVAAAVSACEAWHLLMRGPRVRRHAAHDRFGRAARTEPPHRSIPARWRCACRDPASLV